MRVQKTIGVLLIVVLVACTARIAAPPAVEVERPRALPDDYYRELAGRGRSVFRVDTARSLVIIEVRRAGSLARFGHDHVVASRDVSGYVAPDDHRADLRVPLDALVVDAPALRAQAGLDTMPSAEDVAGTRKNMLEKVLETDRYPDALISVNDLGSRAGARLLRAAVTLHGVTVPVDVTAQVDEKAGGIHVSGTLALEQSRFGITPFAILGGAIAVQDRISVRFQIFAQPSI